MHYLLLEILYCPYVRLELMSKDTIREAVTFNLLFQKYVKFGGGGLLHNKGILTQVESPKIHFNISLYENWHGESFHGTFSLHKNFPLNPHSEALWGEGGYLEYFFSGVGGNF